MKCEKLGNHTISYQSLLLSTTVLNDVCSISHSQKCEDFDLYISKIMFLKMTDHAVHDLD